MPEAIFRPNDSLLSTLGEAMREDGCGFFEIMIAKSRVRRMSANQRQELERRLTDKVQAAVSAGELKLPVSANVVGGVLVSSWKDLFAWFVENLPAILEMIATIMALFASQSSIIAGLLAFLAVGLLLCGESLAQCPGGVCQRPVQAAKAVATKSVLVKPVAVTKQVVQKQPVRKVVRIRLFRRWR
jgi:hypothetical protein